jgi:predicted nucleotidyltransferase
VTSTHPGWQALIVPTSRRDEVRASLLQLARVDDRVAGAAITGSAAAGREDRWSDVDLFFGVTDVAEVLADFSRYLYDELGALHHFDLAAGPAAYRGFLLPGLLEVDLGFTRSASSGPTAPRRSSSPSASRSRRVRPRGRTSTS